MKNFNEKTVTIDAKQAYEKPAMEVIEMEADAAVLYDTRSGDMGDHDGEGI